MAEEAHSLELESLKRRLALVESEVRVFTPPVSRLERDLWEFRMNANQRFDAVDRRLDRLATNLDRQGTNLESFRQEVSERFEEVSERFRTVNEQLNRVAIALETYGKEFADFRGQMLALLREIVERKP